MAIMALCSHLYAGGTKPFEPAEWAALSDLLAEKGIEPHELMSFSNEDFRSKLGLPSDVAWRMAQLIERTGSILTEVAKYASMGINVMTKADSHYPEALVKKLGKSCPPIFYYAGDPGLTRKNFAGFVGSRTVGMGDESALVREVSMDYSRTKKQTWFLFCLLLFSPFFIERFLIAPITLTREPLYIWGAIHWIYCYLAYGAACYFYFKWRKKVDDKIRVKPVKRELKWAFLAVVMGVAVSRVFELVAVHVFGSAVIRIGAPMVYREFVHFIKMESMWLSIGTFVTYLLCLLGTGSPLTGSYALSITSPVRICTEYPDSA